MVCHCLSFFYPHCTRSALAETVLSVGEISDASTYRCRCGLNIFSSSFPAVSSLHDGLKEEWAISPFLPLLMRTRRTLCYRVCTGNTCAQTRIIYPKEEHWINRDFWFQCFYGYAISWARDFFVLKGACRFVLFCLIGCVGKNASTMLAIISGPTGALVRSALNIFRPSLHGSRFTSSASWSQQLVLLPVIVCHRFFVATLSLADLMAMSERTALCSPQSVTFLSELGNFIHPPVRGWWPSVICTRSGQPMLYRPVAGGTMAYLLSACPIVCFQCCISQVWPSFREAVPFGAVPCSSLPYTFYLCVLLLRRFSRFAPICALEKLWTGRSFEYCCCSYV